MELPQDKILPSFMELLHHHCWRFNNKIVIGCRHGGTGSGNDAAGGECKFRVETMEKCVVFGGAIWISLIFSIVSEKCQHRNCFFFL